MVVAGNQALVVYWSCTWVIHLRCTKPQGTKELLLLYSIRQETPLTRQLLAIVNKDPQRHTRHTAWE